MDGRRVPTMRVCLLSVLMATWMPSVFGNLSISLYPDIPELNQTVLFDVTGIIGQIRSLNWYRGHNTSAENQFLRMNSIGEIFPGTIQVVGASLFPNGSLQIKNIKEEHKGNYTIAVQADQLLQATQFLSVRGSESSKGGGLSGGAIAGIVIGVLAAVVAVAGFAVYYNKKNSRTTASSI